MGAASAAWHCRSGTLAAEGGVYLAAGARPPTSGRALLLLPGQEVHVDFLRTCPRLSGSRVPSSRAVIMRAERTRGLTTRRGGPYCHGWVNTLRPPWTSLSLLVALMAREGGKGSGWSEEPALDRSSVSRTQHTCQPGVNGRHCLPRSPWPGTYGRVMALPPGPSGACRPEPWEAATRRGR